MCVCVCVCVSYTLYLTHTGTRAHTLIWSSGNQVHLLLIKTKLVMTKVINKTHRSDRETVLCCGNIAFYSSVLESTLHIKCSPR